MDEHEWLADGFEEHRAHLRAVAYRMLGSLAEADDAVQDTWLRVRRAGSDGADGADGSDGADGADGADGIANLRGWLTTITARVCLNMLRSRAVRREEPLDARVPDPVVSLEAQPEQVALLADSVGLALQVVLDTLTPAERLAFVLHDMFELPFDEIAPMLDRTPVAARQLASRARRRVRGAEVPAADADPARQRRVVDAFFAAAREGDFDALLAVLDPGVVLRIDAGAALPSASVAVRGAEAVARQTLMGLRSGLRRVELLPVLVNGAAGVLLSARGRPMTVIGFTVAAGRITEIDSIADPARVDRITAGVTLPDTP